MSVIAKLNNLRIAPRKVRMVADLIRGKDADNALEVLSLVKNKTAQPMAKLLKSAMANAKNNFQLATDKLYIAILLVNEGQKLKRFRPVSRGRANDIIKRNSNITLMLEEKKIRERKDTESIRNTEKKGKTVTKTKKHVA